MKMNIDMSEATRLTRLGRLDEAMVILRGGVPAAEREPAPSEALSPFIDMVQTSDAKKMWRAASRADTSDKIDLAQLVSRQKAAGRAGSDASLRKPVPAGASFDELTFSNHAGHRAYKLYVPANYDGRPAPLIVMLHGCTQSSDDFAAGTQMNALAEVHGFLVAYPTQSQSANMNRCWNWFNTADQQRDLGEPSIIAGITQQVMVDHAIDPQRVFVAGLSAGGDMAAVMGEVYPELYAGVGVHSGLPARAAHDMPSAFAVMNKGANMGAKTSSVRAAQPVRTIVFHGDADKTVHVTNGEQVAAQASVGVSSIIISGKSDGGVVYTTTVERDDSGIPVVEHWLLHGAGHAWSGGSASGSYTEPRGPDASREMVRFFLDRRPAGKGL